MSFELKILGSNSATPVYNRHHSAQLLTIDNQVFLIDCGEATQHQLIRYKLKPTKINYIFISHLHGDHYLGLVGLLSSMHLHGRKKDLHIFGPPGLDEIITIQLKYSETFLSYKLIFTPLDTEKHQAILELDNLTVYTLPLVHRIKCCGFLFKEKPKRRRINKLKLPATISLLDIIALKNGEDILDEQGTLLYKNSEVTLPPKKSRSYAYCSDTKYSEALIPWIENVDLLYHESTFTSEMQERAKETYHSTAAEAATIALKAKVNQLIIGHFSSRYKELEPLLEEAKKVFSNTYLAIEGENFTIED